MFQVVLCIRDNVNKVPRAMPNLKLVFKLLSVNIWHQVQKTREELLRWTSKTQVCWEQKLLSTYLLSKFCIYCLVYTYSDLRQQWPFEKNPFSKLWILSCAKNYSLAIWEAVVFSQLWGLFPDRCHSADSWENPLRSVLSPWGGGDSPSRKMFWKRLAQLQRPPCFWGSSKRVYSMPGVWRQWILCGVPQTWTHISLRHRSSWGAPRRVW